MTDNPHDPHDAVLLAATEIVLRRLGARFVVFVAAIPGEGEGTLHLVSRPLTNFDVPEMRQVADRVVATLSADGRPVIDRRSE